MCYPLWGKLIACLTKNPLQVGTTCRNGLGLRTPLGRGNKGVANNLFLFMVKICYNLIFVATKYYIGCP